jgi:prolyl oligopeptidase
VFGEGLDPTNYYGCSVSRDGRWLVVTASAGTRPARRRLAVRPRRRRPPAEVQVGVDARCSRTSSATAGSGCSPTGTPRAGGCASRTRRAPQDWTTVLEEDPEAVLEDWALLDDGVVAALRSRHALSS